MKKTISVKKLLRGSFIALLCLLAAIIAVYGTYSIRTYADYVLGATEEQLAAYAMRLEEEMDDLAAFNLELTRNDSDFAMLSFPDCSEKQTLLSMYNLRRIFSAGIDEYCAIILYDPDGVGLYFTFDDDAAWSLSALEKRRLVRDNLPLILEMGEPLSETWVELTGEYNASSLMTVNRNRNLHLATVLSLEQYIKRNTIPIFSPASIATIATEGRILLQEEEFENLGLTAEALAEMRSGKLLTSLRTGYLCKSVPVSGSSLYVTTLIPVRDLAHAMVPSVIFLALVLLLVTAAMIITYRLLVKLLYFPIEEAAQLSKHLNDLDRPRVLEGNRFVEFNEIMRATLDLLDQKELLEVSVLPAANQVPFLSQLPEELVSHAGERRKTADADDDHCLLQSSSVYLPRQYAGSDPGRGAAGGDGLSPDYFSGHGCAAAADDPRAGRAAGVLCALASDPDLSGEHV